MERKPSSRWKVNRLATGGCAGTLAEEERDR
jgi:hypothetical protein